MATMKATTDAPHPTSTKKYVLPYSNTEGVLVGTATEMVVVVAIYCQG